MAENRVTSVSAQVLSSGATATKARVSEVAVQVLCSTTVFVPPASSSSPVIICVT